MRTLLAIFLVSISGIGGAFADDLTPRPSLSNSLSPNYAWNGFYVGELLGGAAGRFHASTSTIDNPAGYFNADSVSVVNAAGSQNLATPGSLTGGLEFGYNGQIGSLVFGLETDFAYFGLRSNGQSSAIYPCCAPYGFTINSSAHTNWLITARPRLGYAYDNWLFFVSGGLAVTDLNAGFSLADNAAGIASESGSLSAMRTGYAFGGGVEAALWANWTVKAEYLHVKFGRASTASANLSSPLAGPFPQSLFAHSVDISANLVRLGVNYHF